VAASVVRQQGKIFTIMMARQMGKNETSAQLEAYLLRLYSGRGGQLVKAAPSFKPQIVNSILRLKDVLGSHPLTRDQWRPSYGYMLTLGRAGISFLSADPKANIVGATASLLLEIDEAQDVDPEKYDRELRPMASSTNATTVLYGTAWAEDSLLERQRRANLEHEARTGERRHFEYDWTHLAQTTEPYRLFVEAEIARLGIDHPSIQTQYLLHTISDAGRLFSEEQRRHLASSRPRLMAPRDGAVYVAGIDLAGEDEEAQDAGSRGYKPKRDSTVITIAEVGRDANGQPTCTVVDHVWWTGKDMVWQFDELVQLWERWRFAYAVVDASGIGAGIASFLTSRYSERVEEFVFTAPSKSQLAYTMLGMTNTARLSIYQEPESHTWRECWTEIRLCRYELKANEILRWSVPEVEGHDDFVVSLALCAHAADQAAPAPHSGLIRSSPYDDAKW
jgi:hypothetical protein